MIKIGDEIIKQNHFPDGTFHLKLSDYIADSAIYDRTIVITWCFDHDAELFVLCCLVDKIRSLNPTIELVLELPYIPHARMDRVEDRQNDIFTLKTFCRIINSLNFSTVCVLNPHSTVAEALIDRIEVETTYVDEIIKEIDNALIMYPDMGAAKKFSKALPQVKNYIIGNKQRDWSTGKITDYQLITDQSIDGKDILIIDDICSYGGTFVAAAKALKAKGANKIYLYVDHCENSILSGEVFNYIDHVYTTDSIFTDNAIDKPLTIIASLRGGAR